MAIEHILDRYRLKEGWDVWKKYEYLFPLQGFSLFSHPSPMAANSFTKADSFFEVVLINHKNFLNVVRGNLEDFHQVLGSSLSPEQILQEYLNGEGLVFDQIRNHDGLFGTLLGFGRDNSWEFKKRGDGRTLEGLEHEDPRDTKHVFLPQFAVLPGTKETMDLRIAYKKQRLLIDTIYQKDDFLSHVLLALCHPPSQ